MANLLPKLLAPLFLWAKVDVNPIPFPTSLNSLLAQNVDTLILIMIDYRLVEMIGKRCLAMFTAIYRLEKTDFIFTKRTKVRLGGCSV
jgi:hypothetical protein